VVTIAHVSGQSCGHALRTVVSDKGDLLRKREFADVSGAISGVFHRPAAALQNLADLQVPGCLPRAVIRMEDVLA
jgi:hypothetical protein